MIKIKTKTQLITTASTLIIIIGAIVLFIIGDEHQKNKKIIATVNGQKIYKSELESQLSQMIKGQEGEQKDEQKIVIENMSPQIIEALAQNIYLQKKIDRLANESKVAKNKKIQKQIKNYQNSVIRKAYLNDLATTSVSEQDIIDKYKQVASKISGKKEMHIRHILVATKTNANNIINQLQNKKLSFEQLAKEYSLDNANAMEGGDLGYVIPDKLDEDFSKAVYDLKKNQTSKPIKTKFGWHIVRLDDIRDAELPTFEEAKIGIKNQLEQEAINKFIDNIIKNTKIKILIKLNSSPSKNEAK